MKTDYCCKLCVVLIFLVCQIFPVGTSGKMTTTPSPISTDCEFPKHKHVPPAALKVLQPLFGKRFETTDDPYYIYNFGICTNAIGDSQDNHVGMMQTNKTSKIMFNLGKYTQTDITLGEDWLLLEYNDGDKYTTHCNKEARRTVVMIICDNNLKEIDSRLRVLKEENTKNEDCYYLFELTHRLICPNVPIITFSLSVGSVLTIIFFTMIGIYFIGGFLYQRFIGGAKGMEQVPHYSFWQDFGNLQADGCSLICRTRRKESTLYKGLGDDQLQEEEVTHDDHLLPM